MKLKHLFQRYRVCEHNEVGCLNDDDCATGLYCKYIFYLLSSLTLVLSCQLGEKNSILICKSNSATVEKLNVAILQDIFSSYYPNWSCHYDFLLWHF